VAQIQDTGVDVPIGMTTTEAPFIEMSRSKGEMYVEQPYGLYSEDNHEAWRRLYARMLPRWEKYANEHFMKGIENLCLNPEAVPKLEDVNQFLCPLTGFSAKAVSGYVPAYLFFDALRNREFPTTITIRRKDKLEYLPEPDIFHDIAGHVPMHTDKAFADTLVRLTPSFGSASAPRPQPRSPRRSRTPRSARTKSPASSGRWPDSSGLRSSPILLVYDRVRPDAGLPGPGTESVRQRSSEFVRGDRVLH